MKGFKSKMLLSLINFDLVVFYLKLQQNIEVKYKIEAQLFINKSTNNKSYNPRIFIFYGSIR